MSEANIKRKNCLYLFANIVIGGFATKIKSCHWCSIYYWKKFFLASILGVKDPFIPFDNFRTKLLNSKATECRSLLFIPGPGCRIQEWMLLPIFDIGHCSAAVLQCCRGHCTSPDAARPLGHDGAASREDCHEMQHGEMLQGILSEYIYVYWMYLNTDEPRSGLNWTCGWLEGFLVVAKPTTLVEADCSFWYLLHEVTNRLLYF